MNQANHVLIWLALAVVGIWGCAQGQPPGPSTAERLKALEVKNTKLEDDFRAVVAARDQLRRKLAAAEEMQQQLNKVLEEIKSISRERDELRQQLAVRTTERDTVLGQFDQFRKGLKELLGQAEAAMPRPGEPVTSAVDNPAAGKL